MLGIPVSGERSPYDNLTPRDVVEQAHQIYEEMLILPPTGDGLSKARALETRLSKIEGATAGMRNSPQWETLFETFFKRSHLLGRAVSQRRDDKSETLWRQAPQRLEELKAQANHLADEYAPKIASFDINDNVLDSVIVLRATLIGELPLAWLSARQWVAFAINQGVTNLIDVQATADGLAIVLKDTGKLFVTYLPSSDYGELYLSAVRITDKYYSAISSTAIRVRDIAREIRGLQHRMVVATKITQRT